MAGLFARGGNAIGSVLGSVAKTVAQKSAEHVGNLWHSGHIQRNAAWHARNAMSVGRMGAQAVNAAAYPVSAMAVGAVRGAADVALGTASMAYRTAKWVGGGSITKWGDEIANIGGHSLKAPRFTGQMEDSLVVGAMGLAAAGGAWNAASAGFSLPSNGGRGGGWGVTQSAVNGQLEIEDDRFLGATGSLTLAMHRSKFGGQQLLPQNSSGQPLQQRAMAYAHLADEAAMMAVHMVR